MSDKNNSYLNLILRCIPKGSTRARNLRDVAIMADVSERQTQEYIRQLREAGHQLFRCLLADISSLMKMILLTSQKPNATWP